MNHDVKDRLAGPGLRWPTALLVIFVALLLLAPAVQAQQGPTPTLDEIQTVARELYCPLCNGVRLDNCDLQACVQMRQVIAERLAAGASKEQIKQEFVAQYGPVVLGEPPREGLNWLIWILPIAALVGGALWILLTVRRWTQAPTGAASVPPAAAPTAGPEAQQSSALYPADDDYLAQVDADLERLG